MLVVLTIKVNIGQHTTIYMGPMEVHCKIVSTLLISSAVTFLADFHVDEKLVQVYGNSILSCKPIFIKQSCIIYSRVAQVLPWRANALHS